MKRTHPEEDVDNESEDTEMDVDDEAKAERSEDDDLDVEDPEDTEAKENGDGFQFLDTFYGLSSANGQERSQASQAMLHYCLIGPDANTKDATYALRRLMNGLCSGRAAARQGNASALASLLKMAVHQGSLVDIQRESQKEGEEETSTLAFIRQRLLAATDPGPGGEGQGKRKSSEDRDYRFGRLFGILGVIRSGILQPSGENSADLEDIISVSSGFLEDLAELYTYKRWMREPAAHAIGTLLNVFYAVCPDSSDATRVIEHLVENVVVPKFLLSGDGKSDDAAPLFASYSAEQVAIVINIQSNVEFHPNGLPSPIKKSVLTKETLPLIASALSETSAVTQPRTHLVWDSIWLFITKSEEAESSKTVDVRKPRKRCPVGDDSIHDVLESIIQHVVVEQLLGIEMQGKESGKTTHERRALALCIVRNLLGAEFVSSIAGRTRLVLEPEVIETVVLSPLLVRRVFIDVIAAGKGGQKQAEHMLKPLALQVLQSTTDTMDDVAEHTSGEITRRRLAVARALLKSDPRFDTRTKTATVSNLLGLGSASQLSEGLVKLWNEHICFLEEKIAGSQPVTSEEESVGVSAYEATGYVDLLFTMGKHVLKVDPTSEPALIEHKTSMTRRLLGFMMASAFFDCMSIENETGKSGKKKKKGKKGKAIEAKDFAIEAASLLKTRRSELTTSLPYAVRSILSARFFSFLAEIVVATVHTSGSDKFSTVLHLMSSLIQSGKRLESAGAKGFAPPLEDSEDSDNDHIEGIVVQLQKAAEEHPGTAESAEKRFAVGCALLSSTLYLHFLSCGKPEDFPEDDDPDADEEGDAEEIASCIADVKHVAGLYSKGHISEENPLFSLAELCANILSSPLGSGSQARGASPKLLREAVRFTWMGGLSSSSSDDTAVDYQVIDILLGSIGAVDEDTADVVEMEEDESESDADNENDDSSEASNDDAVFSEAAGVPGVMVDDASQDSNDKADEDDASDKDLELNSEKLQSMLEDDSDASVEGFVLEHHAGADAALAKLIQLKQDARKAGQLARERMEISRQLRCTILLETLLNGKPDGWGSLLRADVVLRMVIPLLSYRRDIEKMIAKGSGKGADSGIGEKRAMLDRLTSLLKTKIFKTKFSGLEWTEPFDTLEFAAHYSSKLMGQAKDKVSKDHQSCCSNGLIALIRAIPDTKEKLASAQFYSDAVSEWATKRTTRLESALFDELIHQNPVVAQAILVDPLTVATRSARTAYLKSESFRMLSLLYNPNLNTNSSALEKNATEALAKAAASVLESVTIAFKDSEMKKTKRIREVTKTAEKTIAFLAITPSSSSLPLTRIGELSMALDQVKDDSDSKGVKNDCNKLQFAIKELSENLPMPDNEDPADEEAAQGGSKSKKKSKSKKTKKKKR